MDSHYGLDIHCSAILDEYREKLPTYKLLESTINSLLNSTITHNSLVVTAIDTRIKSEASLAGKLELKGHKYSSLEDITDIVGARIITFYTDDVDKVAALIGNLFDIDWNRSVDKRKMLDLKSFGYQSLHYICRLPKRVYSHIEHPELNSIWFEIQMRTTLQHMWATMDHDTGYKSGIEIPKEYLRTMHSLAGVLELVDEEFSRLRTTINDYRRNVEELVKNGRFEEVQLDAETFRSYLKLNQFDKLNRRIAAINQAEIVTHTLMPYLTVLLEFGFKTLGDVEALIKEYSSDAYKLAVHQIGGTDLDIISSNVGIQDLLIVYLIKQGKGIEGLVKMFDLLDSPSEYNRKRAERIFQQVDSLHLQR